ncbi:MAG: 30S ribosomal protein S16 [Armatimonadota bacterium]
MVKIRLRRMGAKKKPFYRIVVADSRCARNGRFIENIGYYDPLKEPPVIKLEIERAEYWLKNGAQPTDIARHLLKLQGLLGGAKPKPEKAEKKSKKVLEAEAKAAAEAAAKAEEEAEAAANEPEAQTAEAPSEETAETE